MFFNKYYVFGNQNVQVPAHLNFGKYILDRLRTKNDETAIENIDTKEKLSYKDVTQYTVNLAASLTKLGVKKGDIVAIGTEKRNEFIPIVLAIVFTGATYTPYDLNSGRAALKHKIDITKPKYFICSQKFLEQYREMIKSYHCVKMVLTIDDAFENVKSVKDLAKEDVEVKLFEPASVNGQTDLACILYSSGTTGLSKGVQLTHLNCILNSLPDDFKDDSLKVAYMSGEWYHNYDTFMTYKFLASGKKILYTEDFNSESVLRSIDEYQANVLILVPSLVSFLSKEGDLSKYNLDSLRIIYSRSSPLHKKTIDKVKQRFPFIKNILQGYGMTEAGELTSESWGHKGPKPGSVGKASPGITLKVSDLETRKTLGPNERGEICLKGPVLMKGYVGMDLSNYMDEEGFFRTGDLGYYDEDSYFYIVGRLKEIIVYNGYNVPPLELETFLQLHPGVRESGVVGKPVPDYGEEPTAFVVKQPGSTVTEQELVDYIAKEMAFGPGVHLLYAEKDTTLLGNIVNFYKYCIIVTGIIVTMFSVILIIGVIKENAEMLLWWLYAISLDAIVRVVHSIFAITAKVIAAGSEHSKMAKISATAYTDFVFVAPYMQLRGGVKFIEELPKNPRGKILRQKLKDMLDDS